MSLNFFSSSSSAKVDHGSDGSLDNLDPFTLWAWVLRIANGGNQHIITKRAAGTVGYRFMVENIAEGQLRLQLDRATSDVEFRSAGQVVQLNVPTFVAVTFDSSLATAVDLYAGTLVHPVYETAYTATTSGSGALSDNAAALQIVGNSQVDSAQAFQGQIGWYGVINRRLTLGELERIRSAQCIQDAHVSGTVLLSGWQETTATQIDLSGRGNHGTVTGATVRGPLPARPIDLPIVGRRAVVAAAGQPTTKRWQGVPGMRIGGATFGQGWAA